MNELLTNISSFSRLPKLLSLYSADSLGRRIHGGCVQVMGELVGAGSRVRGVE
jgi:hypothetical protein